MRVSPSLSVWARLLSSLLAAVSLVCTVAHAAPGSARTAVAGFYPEAKIESAASGLLDTQGDFYHVALIQSASVPDQQLLVVKETAAGKLSKLIDSSSFFYRGRTIAKVGIKASSIYLTLHGSTGCCGYSGTAYQFEQSAGRFILVGVEAVGVNFSDDNGARRLYESRSSVNFLTMTAVFSGRAGSADIPWQQGNLRYPEWMPYRIARADESMEKTTKFKVNRQWALDDFDSFLYAEWASEVVGLCGYFDKAMVFVVCQNPR